MNPTHPRTAETQLAKWGAVIDAIVADAEQAGIGLASDFRTSFRDLEVKQRAAQAELERFRASGSERWRTFKTGAAGAWQTLEVALLKLTKREGQIPSA